MDTLVRLSDCDATFTGLWPLFYTMWNNLCDDEHDEHAMKLTHRAFMAIFVCFVTFAGYAISTRLGADVPPTSVTYGTEKPQDGAAVFGD